MRLLTSSGIKAFKDCGQKYAYRYDEMLEEVRRSPALAFGTAVHAGLEHYWGARRDGKPNPVRCAWDALPYDLDPFDREKAMALLHAYHYVWRRARVEVVGIEVPFELPLIDPMTGDAHPFFKRAGKIDLILRQSDGKILLVEHKTTSDTVQAGGAYRQRLILDEQISYYFDAAEALGIKPDVIIYDVLRKPTEKPYTATLNLKLKKNGEPYKNQRAKDELASEYGDRLIDMFDETPGDYIFRIPVYRFSSEQSAIKEAIWNAAETIAFVQERGIYMKNSDACQRKYGACPFLGLCEGSARRDDITKFRVMEDAHPELREPRA